MVGSLSDVWEELKRDGVKLLVMLVLLVAVFLLLTMIRACKSII
jgi:hypothetical protein